MRKISERRYNLIKAKIFWYIYTMYKCFLKNSTERIPTIGALVIALFL